MRVLDFGCGAGDVTFLVAELTGSDGEVVGVDRSEVAIDVAEQRARSLGSDRVSFIQSDASDSRLEGRFDAVVGRYVLMFQPDPAATLQALSKCVRPGGAIIFHELDWGGVRSAPPCRTFDQCRDWAIQALPVGGADPYFGTKAHSTFLRAGLPPPTIRLEAIVAYATDGSELLRSVVDTYFPASFIPALEQAGITTAAKVGIETLPDRMYEEIARNGSVVIGRSEIGVWTRL